MPAENQKNEITARVRDLLRGAEDRGVHLRLAGSRFGDEWLYLVVESTQKGERASTHAHLMTKIERELENEGYEHVLLVPAVPESAGLMDIEGEHESSVAG